MKVLTNRTISSFISKLNTQGVSSQEAVFRINTAISFITWLSLTKHISESDHIRFRNELYRAKSEYTRSKAPLGSFPLKYVGFSLAALTLLLLGIGIYLRFYKNEKSTFAYSTAPLRSGRIISFQGRMTDTLGNPITAPIDVSYSFYTTPTGGSPITGSTRVCTASPDQDGVFNSLIGNDTGPSCNTELPSTIFSENTNVYLGITIGSEITEMSPRQQIANVGYAINSETLQGMPPGQEVSNIPFINQDGNMLIAASNPGLRSTYASSNFTISSAQATTIQSAGSGDITLSATEGGALRFKTYSGTLGERMTILANGNVGIGNTNPSVLLSVGGNATVSGSLVAGGQIKIGEFGSAPTTYGNGSMYYDTSTNKIYYWNGTVWTDLASSSSQYFQRTLGSLAPTNITDDLNLGAVATGSAMVHLPGLTNKDAFFNLGTGNVGIGNTAPGAKLDIGLAGTTLGTIRLAGNTSGYTQIQPSAAAGSWTLTLPTSGGTNNYVLTTNGSGATSWTAPGSLGVKWSDITSPTGNLALTMGAYTSTFTYNGTTGAGVNLFNLTDTASNTGTGYLLNLTTAASSALHPLHVSVNGGTEGLMVDTTGYVGIGTTAPAAKLDLLGNLNVSTYATVGASLAVGYANAPAGPGNAIFSGNVGIGTTNPSYPFQVYGLGVNLSSQIVPGAAAGSTDVSSGLWRVSTLFTGNNNQVLTIQGSRTQTTVGSAIDVPPAFSPTSGSVAWSAINLIPTINQTGGANGTTRGLYINPTLTSATSFRGIEIANNTGYGVYQSGASANNYYAGNVGIGITAPNAKLDVAGTASVSGVLTVGNGTTNQIQSPYGPLSLNYKSGLNTWAPGLTVQDTTGNVGIGMTTPVGSKVYIDSNQGDVDNSALKIIFNGGTTILGEVAALAHRNSQWSGFYINGTGSSLTNALFVEGNKQVILNAGNVGIGTTSPTAKLDVNGNLNVSSYATVSASLALGTSSAAAGPGNLNMSGILTVSGAIKPGGVAGTSGYLLTSSAGGVNTWTDPSTLAGTNYWQRTLGSLAPVNITDDINVGAVATGSAIVHLPGLTNKNTFFNLGTGIVGIGTSAPTLGKLQVVGGNIIVDTTNGIDTATAGTLALGDVTAATINIGSTAGTAINVGAGGSLARAISIGTGTGIDTINVGTGVTGVDVIRIGQAAADLALTDAQWSISNIGAFAGVTGAFTTSITTPRITGLTTDGIVYVSGANGTLNSETTLATVRGGLGANMTAAGAGELPYSTSTTAYGHLAAGTSNFILKANGASAPSWVDPATLGLANFWQRTLGSLAPLNITDDVNIGAIATGSALVHLPGLTNQNAWFNLGTGNVGIGTTSPISTFHINGTTSITGGTSVPASGEGMFLRYNSSTAYLTSQLVGSGMRNFEFGAADIIFKAGSGASPTERMRITSGGNVGIGTTSPTAKLDVNGNLNVSSYATVSASLALGTSSAAAGPGNLDMSGNLTISGAIKPGGAAGTSGYLLTSTAGGVNTWTDPASISGVWQRTLGSLAPKNITDDVNVGAVATGSAIVHLPGLTNQNAFFNLGTGNVGIGTTGPTSTLDVVSPASTTNGFSLTANSLTTGKAFNLSSTSTGITTGSLVNIDWSPGSTVTTTSDLFSLNIGANGTMANLFNIKDANSSLFSVSETAITSNLPTSFTSAGDVSMAYDLIFTNPTSSYVKSAAPLYIQAGETFGSSNLTLQAYNAGTIVFDSPGGVVLNQAQTWDLANSSATSLNIESGLLDFDTTNSRIGIGTTAPSYTLDVSGGSGIMAQFSGRVIGANAVNTNEFATLGQIAGGAGQYWQRNLGSIAPTNITDDVNIGAIATGSALVHLPGLTNQNAFFNLGTGNVGIGVTSPASKLSIGSDGNSIYTVYVSNGDDYGVYASGMNYGLWGSGSNAGVYGTGAGTGDGVYGSSTSSGRGVLGTNNNAAGYGVYGMNLSSGVGGYFTSTSGYALLTGTGNVGIGNPAPTAKLDVNGNLKVSSYATASASLALGTSSAAAGPGHLNMSGNLTISGAIKPGGAAGTTGYLLTSSAGGVNTWTDPTSLGGVWQRTLGSLAPLNITDDVNIGAIATGSAMVHLPGLTNQNAFFNLGTGNVGIGTTTPTSTLDVVTTTTTGNGINLTASSVTTGSALNIVGPTSTGIYGSTGLVSLASNLGHFGSGNLLYLAPNFSSAFGSGGSGIYVDGTDSTSSTNLNTGIYSALNYTGNAAKWATAVKGVINSSSTTADTLYASYMSPGATGAISTGTRYVLGYFSTPSSTGANTGGTTNVTGGYYQPAASNSTTGSTVNVTGIEISTAGTLTTDGTLNQYGIKINTGTSSTVGTSIKYGLYVANQTGADNNYAIYTNAGKNRLGDDLQVVGYASISASLALGTSTAAAGPGHLDMSGNLTVGTAYIAGVNGSGTTGYLLTSAAGGVNTWTDPTTIGGYWQRTLGSLAPKNITDDINVGAIATDSAMVHLPGLTNQNAWFNLGVGNVGIGTTAPTAKLDLLGNLNVSTYATVGASLAVGYANAPAGPGNAIFSGNVGIGTTGPANTLDVVGTLGITGTLGAITTSGTGNNLNFSRASTNYINATDASGTLHLGAKATNSILQINGGATGSFQIASTATANSLVLSGGFVGIGTTAPLAKLAINGGLHVGGDSDPGDNNLWVDNEIQAVKFTDKNSSTYYISPGNGAFLSGNIRIDSSVSAASKISFVDNSLGTPMIASISAATNTAGGYSIYLTSGAQVGNAGTNVCVGDPSLTGGGVPYCNGKIDAGTVDPPYTINGKRYATYMASMTGVKEETTGHVALTTKSKTVNGYEYVIDFNAQTDGSDLWLFAKATALRTKLDRMSVLMSPSDNARTWYKIDSARQLLTLYSSRPTTISYRLTAPRFDEEKWKNITPNGSDGHIINDPDIASLNDIQIDGNGNVGGQLVASAGSESGYQVLDEIGSMVEETVLQAKTVSAHIIAGLLEAQKIISPLAEIETLIVKNKITSPIIETDSLKASKSLEVPLVKTNEIQIGAQPGQLAKLVIKGLNNAPIVQIDETGNATFAGTLTAESVVSRQSKVDSLEAQNASVSGTLIAKNVQSENINAIESNVASLSSTLASSSSQFASDINAVQQELASIKDIPLPDPAYYQNIDASYTNLTVNDTANLYKAHIADSLVVGTLFIQPSSILALSNDLRISSLGTIRLFDDAVIIAKNGDMAIKGEIAATSLAIKNTEGTVVASIDASGSARFNEVIAKKFTLDTIATQGAVIADSGIRNDLNAIIPAIKTNKEVAGTGTVPQDSKEVIIYNDNITDNSLIYLTPTTNNIQGQLSVSKKVTPPPGLSREALAEWGSPYFIVSSSSDIHMPSTFNWLIIN